MKKVFITILAVVFVFSGCGLNKENLSDEEVNGKTTDETVKRQSISVKGKVIKIQRGKDGYMAEIRTDDDKQYSAVISSVNMEGSGQYREVEVGDVISFEGEVISSKSNLIRVTSLK